MYVQSFSERLELKTIILIPHDLSNVDFVLNDFLNDSIIWILLIWKNK